MWFDSKKYTWKLNFPVNFTSPCQKYHPVTTIIVIWTSYSDSLIPKNIILDTRIIKISHVDQKIWKKVKTFIFGGGHFEKIQDGHQQELIAPGTPSEIDHYDLP